MRPLLLCVIALALGFAPAPFPRTTRAPTPRADLARMQGTWDIVEWYYRGRPQDNKGGQIILDGERWGFRFDGRITLDWDIKLAPAAFPRTLDFREVNNPKHLLQAIYRFDGDRLIVCYSSWETRPTSFEPVGVHWLMILKPARK